jgi:hypothetical protein
MAATPESLVKKKIHAVLKEMGAYAVNYIGGLAANNGTPDILACHEGRFVGIEAKAGKNKPTDLQISNLRKIYEAGGISLVINENNIDVIKFALAFKNPFTNYNEFLTAHRSIDDGTGTPRIKSRHKDADRSDT